MSRPHVRVSARVHDRQVGGNTRYVREVYARIAGEGISFELARPAFAQSKTPLRSVSYAVAEGVLWPSTRSRHADLLHFPADTGAIVRGKSAIVSTIHGLATLHVPDVRRRSADQLWRGRVRRLARVSDLIITVSESSADDIAFFEPSTAGRIRVIPHGIDHEKFSPPTSIELADAQSPGSPYYLYMGNLDPRKNIIALCIAAEIVFKQTGVPLVISGAPAWESEEIMRVVKSTPGVNYRGRVSDEELVPLIRGAVAFCFPSSYEGFGFPVLEAMACGTPVICSDRGSLKEIAGDAALVISDIGAASIAEAMLTMLNSAEQQRAFSERGLENAQAYSWGKSAAAHASVFREVTG